MKVAIPVRDRAEATAVKTAMEDATVRACVTVMGILDQLPTTRARLRVLAFIADVVNDQARPPAPIGNRLALAEEKEEEIAARPHASVPVVE